MNSERTLQSVVDSLGEHGDKTALLVFGKKDRHRWPFRNWQLARARSGMGSSGMILNAAIP